MTDALLYIQLFSIIKPKGLNISIKSNMYNLFHLCFCFAATDNGKLFMSHYVTLEDCCEGITRCAGQSGHEKGPFMLAVRCRQI